MYICVYIFFFFYPAELKVFSHSHFLFVAPLPGSGSEYTEEEAETFKSNPIGWLAVGVVKLGGAKLICPDKVISPVFTAKKWNSNKKITCMNRPLCWAINKAAPMLLARETPSVTSQRAVHNKH